MMTFLKRVTSQRASGNRQAGFSTLAMAFVLLALTFPIVMIAQSVLVSARQASGNALGQENLRAVDAAMSEVMADIRLDEFAVNKGCADGPLLANDHVFTNNKSRPSQGPLFIEVRCQAEQVSGARRVLKLETFIRQNSASPWVRRGQARVKYLDEVGGASIPGADLLVCDWHLGEFTGSLAPCPP